jgi:Outer membrane efflux protein
MASFGKHRCLKSATLIALIVFVSVTCAAQKKAKPQSKKAEPPPQTQLAKLRDEYIKSAKEYQASLQKLLSLYQNSVKKAEQHHEQMQKLLVDGLISKSELEQSEIALTDAKVKVTGVEQQIAGADTQIANAFVEIEGEKQLAKLGPARRGSLVQTTSFIRFAGAGSWVLSQASPIESFFQQTFKRPLPIAVFGQGAIHNQWRLDHRNAMDISLNPDGAEGQALIRFLQSNGIPFSAFRGAIPGVATGPHIHIGLPSHRY